MKSIILFLFLCVASFSQNSLSYKFEAENCILQGGRKGYVEYADGKGSGIWISSRSGEKLELILNEISEKEYYIVVKSNSGSLFLEINRVLYPVFRKSIKGITFLKGRDDFYSEFETLKKIKLKKGDKINIINRANYWLFIDWIGLKEKSENDFLINDPEILENPEIFERSINLSYPTFTTPRKIIKLTGEWEISPSSSPDEIPSVRWEKVIVPQSIWFTISDISKDSVCHWACYRKDFTIEEKNIDSRYILNIWGVKQRGKIYINNKFVEEFLMGGFGFKIDVTEYIKEGKNEIFIFLGDGFTIQDEMGRHWSVVHGPLRNIYGKNTGGASFYGDIFIEELPSVFIKDIFINTSYREDTLKIDIIVKNTTEKKEKLILDNKIYDREGKLVLKSGGKEIIVPERDELKISIIEKNKGKLKYWSPSSPTLYFLETEIKNPHFTDKKITRFGFREVWAEKDKLYLNGVPIYLRIQSMPNASDYKIVRENVKELIKNGWNCVRTHGGDMNDPEVFDICDEEGMLVIAESYQYCDSNNAWNDPRFWKNFEMHCLRMVEMCKNHPSIISYSLENEGLWCGIKGVNPKAPELLAEIGKKVNEIDPTRLIQYNGDNDVEGFAPIVNLHYPKEISNCFLWPIDIYWLVDKKGKIKYDGTLGYFEWNRDKPLILGECLYGGFDKIKNCLSLSSFGGEEVFKKGMMIKTYKDISQLMSLGYRMAGVSGINPWYVGGFKPWVIGCFPIEWYASYEPEKTYLEKFFIFNDSYHNINLKLDVWIEEENGKILYRTSDRIFLKSGEEKNLPIKIRIPETKETKKVYLYYSLTKDGGIIFKDKRKKVILITSPIVKSSQKLGIYNISEEIENLLGSTGVDYIKCEDLDNLKDIDILITGVEGKDKNFEKKLKTFLEKGGKVFILVRDDNLPSFITERGIELSNWSMTNSFKGNNLHPITENLPEELLSYWREDYFVANKTFIKPLEGPARIITEGGCPKGLILTPLLEIPEENGTILISTYNFEKWKLESSTKEIFVRCLNYLINYKTEKRYTLGVLAEDLTLNFLRKIGVDYEDLTLRKNVELKDYKVILIDGNFSKSGWDLSIEKIKDFVISGNKLILHNITEENYSKYKTLFPPNLTIKKFVHLNNTPPKIERISNHPFINGISQFEFYWLSNAPIFEYIIESSSLEGDDFSPLTQPAVIGVIKYGKGWIILDNLLWDKYEYFEPENMKRYCRNLLLNLGCGFRKNLLSETSFYTSIPLENYYNRELIDEIENDGKGGWLDQGQNDMREFPRGNIKFKDIPFYIPEKGKACIMLKGERFISQEIPEKVEDIEINKYVKEIYFLHTCCFGFDQLVGKEIFTYVIHYEDETKVSVPVIYGENIYDWWQYSPDYLKNTFLAWSGKNSVHVPLSVYIFKWENPFPTKKIISLDFVSKQTRAIPVLFGITVKEIISNIKQNSFMSLNKDSSIWAIIGPFPNNFSSDGLDHVYFPEIEPMDLNKEYLVENMKIKWKKVFVNKDTQKGGFYIDLNSQFYPNDWVVAYAYTEIYSPQEQEVIIKFGSDDGAKIWLNGENIHYIKKQRSCSLTDEIKTILKKGWNPLLIKIEERTGSWGFAIKITDINGREIDNITLNFHKEI